MNRRTPALPATSTLALPAVTGLSPANAQAAPGESSLAEVLTLDNDRFDGDAADLRHRHRGRAGGPGSRGGLQGGPPRRRVPGRDLLRPDQAFRLLPVDPDQVPPEVRAHVAPCTDRQALEPALLTTAAVRAGAWRRGWPASPPGWRSSPVSAWADEGYRVVGISVEPGDGGPTHSGVSRARGELDRARPFPRHRDG